MATTLDTYAPFDSGAGGSVTEDTWRKFMRHMLGSASGVIRGFQNGCAPSATGSGMTVTVDTGECWMRGHYGENASLKTLPIAAAHATLARKDRIIVRADFTNNRIELDVLTGTASGSPVVPSVTQTTSIWETSIGIVAVAATVTVINSGNVTDDRVYTSAQARYAASSNQGTAPTVYTKIAFSSTAITLSGDISFDPTTNNFTLLRAGQWVGKAQTRWAADGVGKREIIIADPATVSGGLCTNLLGEQAGAPVAGIEACLSCVAIFRAPINQVVAAFAFHNSSTNPLNIVSANNGTDISLMWAGP